MHSSVHYGYCCIGVNARSMKSPIRQCGLLLMAFTVSTEPALAGRNYLNCHTNKSHYHGVSEGKVVLEHRPDRNPAAQQAPAFAEICYSFCWKHGRLRFETARLHHAARQRGSRVAARGARAAAGPSAAHRRAHEPGCG